MEFTTSISKPIQNRKSSANTHKILLDELLERAEMAKNMRLGVDFNEIFFKAIRNIIK